LAAGGRNNRPLSARTVSHCHFVLHRALERAVEIELLTRNVAHAISSPKVEAVEIETFKADEIALVLAAPSMAIRSTPMGWAGGGARSCASINWPRCRATACGTATCRH